MTNTTTAIPAEPQAAPAGQVHESVVEEHHEKPHHQRVIALAVDASKFSRFAFDWAMDNIINPETDQVVLLNVRPYVNAPIIYTAPMMDLGETLILPDVLGPDEYTKLDEANKAVSHDLIRKYAADLIKKKIKCKGIALRGDAREEIVYKVDDIKADMLIIGSRGMGALKRTFIGSTSDYCVHHCKCTVIVPKQ